MRPHCVSTVDVWVSCHATSFLVLLWHFHVNSEVPGSFLCRYESPRTLVHFCIFLPHLRTRRCVLMVFSRYKSPCTLPIRLTRCPEYPRTLRCNWTLHSRRTCRSTRDQIQRRFWLCHNPLFSFLFLHPFAIVSGQLVELKFWVQQIWAEVADVKQMEKILPLITCEISLCQYVCELDVWCRHIWFESLDPDWFCQTTSQEQLCGFWIRVSLLDFCLWWSF